MGDLIRHGNSIIEISMALVFLLASRSTCSDCLLCFSGGTIAGLAIGSWLSSLKAKVTAYCVCDDPRYFYDYAQDLLDGIQANVNSRDIVNIVNAKGLGYAMNTSEELQFVKQVAEATGVILDPVYRYD
ncbi:hypothetical protein Leryth_015265 [Lithospermum erythrorhizon]|nr:hypothetical protein Leryth_015265 [Lithospermum erythrorhizon]